MTVSESIPAVEAARLPEAAERAVPVAKSQVAEALQRATRTDDPRAIAEYLELRRTK